MMDTQSGTRALIVGAGPAGSLMAILLGRRGMQVEVYERRADPRPLADEAVERRSINLGLSHRGITALTEAGVLDDVMKTAVRARGRVIHTTDGRTAFQPYGSDDSEILYSISRNALNRALIEHADRLPNVRFTFQAPLVELDREGPVATFRREDGATERVEADFVVGADGAYSTVRQWMHRNERADYAQEFLPWGYKELLIPPGEGGGSRIELEALHIWPRGDALIVTHPNPDGSHTASVFMPFEGERSFSALQTETDVGRFFATVFPDVPGLVPDLEAEWMRHPTGTLVATRTAPWHHREKCVLLGDGCHAVWPFYGQGMNAALEDCLVLNRALDRHPADRHAAFRSYQAERKVNTDALMELVRLNFDELRAGSDHPAFVARKKLDLLLHRLFPKKWVPLYTMVVHTTIPYAEALARWRRQQTLLRRLGVDSLLGAALFVPFAIRRTAAALRGQPRAAVPSRARAGART
jgi:kynurenine 3-monooxygenase